MNYEYMNYEYMNYEYMNYALLVQPVFINFAVERALRNAEFFGGFFASVAIFF
jgi:hypothetical protein